MAGRCLLAVAAAAAALVVLSSQRCDGFGTFGFDVHHRYSDPVKGILDLDGLPEKGSLHYYAAMAQRDRLFRGRHLAATAAESPLTFAAGNDTLRIAGLGHLYYANVSVGSPGLWFLVALDTGSDLFWLPCDCTQCVTGLKSGSGDEIDLNIYSLNKSSTSMKVSCNSTFCGKQRQCSSKHNACAYQIQYLSNNTSSSGLIVEDILHLTSDDRQLKKVDAQIPFGCGIVQTGSFLDGAAPNGLFGLGMDNVSVPSVLSKKGLSANSFSMCFGPDGIGRISFGDKGSLEQGETPFNVHSSHPTYNVSLEQILVGDNVSDVSFSAIFDSGTSFTYLNDPAYKVISESFNSQAKEKRHPSDSRLPFEYCYELSLNQTIFEIPSLNFTMQGGKQFFVTDPIVQLSIEGEGNLYCLAVVKSEDINIIGQNFMTGYRIVFNREKMALGWEASNCYDTTNSNLLPINPQNSSAVPPASTVEPQATSGPQSGSDNPTPSAVPPPENSSPHLNSLAGTLFMAFICLGVHYYIIIDPSW
ncbi:aspartyl protease family protein 1-like [Diospyros lotus]|uniref:aspartyl protease family protein 1-like n=1 Tax=Diospyros lotus TaxID=55363 RepID=UPI0022574F07|nr:aspartyl protease family protein 1-like [Diospyros lotus]